MMVAVSKEYLGHLLSTLSRYKLRLQSLQSTVNFLEGAPWSVKNLQCLKPTGLPFGFLHILADTDNCSRLLGVDLQYIDQAMNINNLVQELLAILEGVLQVTKIPNYGTRYLDDGNNAGRDRKRVRHISSFEIATVEGKEVHMMV